MDNYEKTMESIALNIKRSGYHINRFTEAKPDNLKQYIQKYGITDNEVKDTFIKMMGSYLFTPEIKEVSDVVKEAYNKIHGEKAWENLSPLRQQIHFDRYAGEFFEINTTETNSPSNLIANQLPLNAFRSNQGINTTATNSPSNLIANQLPLNAFRSNQGINTTATNSPSNLVANQLPLNAFRSNQGINTTATNSPSNLVANQLPLNAITSNQGINTTENNSPSNLVANQTGNMPLPFNETNSPPLKPINDYVMEQYGKGLSDQPSGDLLPRDRATRLTSYLI
jgi:hypothetical protein